MDPSAPWTVIYGTLTTSAASALTVGAYGALLGRPLPTVAAGFAAFNAGMTAVTFFGIREFIVSPMLVHNAPWPQYARRREELGLASPLDPTSPRSMSELRWQNILDSGISGAITGGLIRGWKSGRKGVLSGGILASIACVGLQYGFNSANVARLNYVSKAKEAEASKQALASKPAEPVSFQDRVLGLFGIVPISDEEYLAKLKRTKSIHEKPVRGTTSKQ
ncbi:hypothetical protein FA15DRAFT_752359 [Coprinopsis marcescibilis]|uniref:Uncharacterized protein n=1 Tax=Coprinopsis marcescibilis TaxID=230819 RepID=A0A5C3LBV1_COPMA|nr:hypothetical protein FA15DRAFT_752359 [Coprinopsis marcescibilis]